MSDYFRNHQYHSYGGNRNRFGQTAPRALIGWDTYDVIVDVLYRQDRENTEFFEEEYAPVNAYTAHDITRLSNWKNSGLDSDLINNIINAKKCAYKIVRPIQAAVIPQVIAGLDILGHTESGGGKSAAFAIPIIDAVIKNHKNNKPTGLSPYAIVIAPTRELCKQLYNTFKKFSDGTPVKLVLSYGEIPKKRTVMELARLCDVIVGTPGRLMDLIESEFLDVKYLKVLVMDEADMLLDDHGKHLNRILQWRSMPKPAMRQTLLFTATVSSQLLAGADQNLRESYVYLSNRRVEQSFVLAIDIHDKITKLCEMLQNEQSRSGQRSRTLIFVESKIDSSFLATRLSRMDMSVQCINGEHSQYQREDLMRQFIEGRFNFLIATDFCLRSWDIPFLDHVINFDLPEFTNDFDEMQFKTTYIRRITRTGRLHDGRSTSFVTEDHTDPRVCKALKEMAEEVGQTVPYWLNDIVEAAGDLIRREERFVSCGAFDGYPSHGVYERFGAENDNATDGTPGFSTEFIREEETSDDDEWSLISESFADEW